MAEKKATNSRTIRVAALVILGGVSTILADLTVEFPNLATNQTFGIAVTVIGAVFAILRFVTKDPVTLKEKRK
jgi:hypothetical protein